mgnify:CR=1 FL=1
MWYVSRQHQWPEGDLVVEISVGGVDYANADMLGTKYYGEGEGQEYDNRKEAVEAGIRVARQWQRDEPNETILIAVGNTGGMTMPFEGEELTDETFKGLRDWAEKEYESLPKCDQCGKLRGKESYYPVDDPDLGKYCSEFCCEKAVRFDWECRMELDVEQLDEEQCRAILEAADYELDETDTLESMRKLILADVKAGEIEESALRV